MAPGHTTSVVPHGCLTRRLARQATHLPHWNGASTGCWLRGRGAAPPPRGRYPTHCAWLQPEQRSHCTHLVKTALARLSSDAAPQAPHAHSVRSSRHGGRASATGAGSSLGGCGGGTQGWAKSSAKTVTVLPRPISSARMPPRGPGACGAGGCDVTAPVSSSTNTGLGCLCGKHIAATACHSSGSASPSSAAPASLLTIQATARRWWGFRIGMRCGRGAVKAGGGKRGTSRAYRSCASNAVAVSPAPGVNAPAQRRTRSRAARTAREALGTHVSQSGSTKCSAQSPS